MIVDEVKFSRYTFRKSDEDLAKTLGYYAGSWKFQFSHNILNIFEKSNTLETVKDLMSVLSDAVFTKPQMPLQIRGVSEDCVWKALEEYKIIDPGGKTIELAEFKKFVTKTKCGWVPSSHDLKSESAVCAPPFVLIETLLIRPHD